MIVGKRKQSGLRTWSGMALTMLLIGSVMLGGCGGRQPADTGAGGDTGTVLESTVQLGNITESGAFAIDVIAANDVGNRAGAIVRLYDEAGTLLGEAVGDDMGGTVFTGAAYGNYTAECEAEGYYSRTVGITVGPGMTEEDLERFVVPLIPEFTGTEAYALLEWSGEAELDLDLCLFDAETGEYTNAAHPMDSRGSALYADRKAEDGYELLLIRDISTDAERSIYVMDKEAAQSAHAGGRTASLMEKQTVDLYIYTAGGAVTHLTPDAAQEAPLWRAATIQNAEVSETKEYTEDLSGDAWVMLRPEDQILREAPEIPEWKAMYFAEVMVVFPYDDVRMVEEAEARADRSVYSVLYIDADEIPELVAVDPEYGRVSLYSIQDGKIVHYTHPDVPTGWQYIPQEGKVLLGTLTDGHMDYTLLRLADGEFTPWKSGYTDAYERSGEQILAYPEGQERCEWNGVPITGYINFEAALTQDFDLSRTREPDVLNEVDRETLYEFLQSE